MQHVTWLLLVSVYVFCTHGEGDFYLITNKSKSWKELTPSFRFHVLNLFETNFTFCTFRVLVMFCLIKKQRHFCFSRNDKSILQQGETGFCEVNPKDYTDVQLIDENNSD